MAFGEHKRQAVAHAEIRVAVITASDTRSPDTDGGGALVEALACEAGWRVTERQLVPDDPDSLRAALGAVVSGRPDQSTPTPNPGGEVARPAATGKADLVIVTGGTGVAPRDVTVDALSPLFERRLDGFGELFRMLSFAEIGPAAMLSRACAGVYAGAVVFLIPGSTAAVRLALQRLILPEGAHLVSELRRGRGPEALPAADFDGPAGRRHHQHPDGSDHHH